MPSGLTHPPFLKSGWALFGHKVPSGYNSIPRPPRGRVITTVLGARPCRARPRGTNWSKQLTQSESSARKRAPRGGDVTAMPNPRPRTNAQGQVTSWQVTPPTYYVDGISHRDPPLGAKSKEQLRTKWKEWWAKFGSKQPSFNQ